MEPESDTKKGPIEEIMVYALEHVISIIDFDLNFFFKFRNK